MYRKGVGGAMMRVWFLEYKTSCVIEPEAERNNDGFRSKKMERDIERVNSGFHLFSRQGPTVVWLELFAQACSPSPMSPLASPRLASASTPVQGLAKKPC